jgi:hypothetical protein
VKQVNVQQASVSTYATPEEIEEFKRRGIEAAREAGLAIDVMEDGNDG